MADEPTIGAHGGGIPPGWDFPEAHQAARDGIDLWLLDATLRTDPWQRVEEAFGVVGLAQYLRAGLSPDKTTAK
jgi:hypothetical protein